MTPSDRKKAPHTLFACKGPAEFMERFQEAAGRPLSELLRLFVSDGGVLTSVLGGSIPLGVGSAVSDVDILSVVAARECLRPTTMAIDIPVIFRSEDGREDHLVSSSVVAVVNGIEIDFDFVLAPQLATLLARVSGGGGYLAPNEIAILSRLKHGWRLEMKPGADVLADLTQSNSLEIRCATQYFVAAVKDLENAQAALADTVPLAFHLGRSCVEKVFASLFASRGYPFVGAKWLRLLNNGVTPFFGAAPDRGALARQGVELLFPNGSAGVEVAMRYLRDVKGFTSAIHAIITADTSFAIAFRICPQLGGGVNSESVGQWR